MHQRRQLSKLIAHAARTVPFYKKRLRPDAKLKPEALTQQRWRRIPIARRVDVQKAGDAIFSSAPPRNHGHVYTERTSGSLGRPLVVKGTAASYYFRRAMNIRGHYWFRRDLSAKAATIRRLGETPGNIPEPVSNRSWAPGHKCGPYVERDVSGSMDDHLAWLAKEKLDYLVTYPTLALSLARHAAKMGIEFPRLRELDTMGEVSDHEVRECFEKSLGIPVVDLYSAREVNVIALQCPENPHYHVQSEAILVEVLDDNGQPCAPGQIGRVVVTPLHNFATPLIRYEIGDFAEVGEPCSCGRGLPVLKRIMGRARNMVTLPSGEKIWACISGGKLMEVAPIQQIQLVQRKLDEIDVNLVVPDALSADREQQLRAALVEMLGYPFTVNLIYTDKIPRSAGGKFEDFRSELPTG